MNKEQLEALKRLYEDVVKIYVDEFSAKQELKFDFWVSDDVGGIAFLSDYSFNFSDIKYDIDNGCPKGLIISWYNDSVDYAMEDDANKTINYHSYYKGLRYEHIKK